MSFIHPCHNTSYSFLQYLDLRHRKRRIRIAYYLLYTAEIVCILHIPVWLKSRLLTSQQGRGWIQYILMRHIYTSNHTNASMWTNSWTQKRNNVKMQHANVFINFWKWRYEAGSAHYNSDVTGSCWWSYHQYLHSLPETSVQYSRGGSQTPREDTAFKKLSERDWSTWIRLFQHPDLWQKYGGLFPPQKKIIILYIYI